MDCYWLLTNGFIEQWIEKTKIQNTDITIPYLITMQYVNNCNVAKLYHPGGYPQGYISYKTIGANSALAHIIGSINYTQDGTLITKIEGY